MLQNSSIIATPTQVASAVGATRGNTPGVLNGVMHERAAWNRLIYGLLIQRLAFPKPRVGGSNPSRRALGVGMPKPVPHFGFAPDPVPNQHFHHHGRRIPHLLMDCVQGGRLHRLLRAQTCMSTYSGGLWLVALPMLPCPRRVPALFAVHADLGTAG